MLDNIEEALIVEPSDGYHEYRLIPHTKPVPWDEIKSQADEVEFLKKIERGKYRRVFRVVINGKEKFYLVSGWKFLSDKDEDYEQKG